LVKLSEDQGAPGQPIAPHNKPSQKIITTQLIHHDLISSAFFIIIKADDTLSASYYLFDLYLFLLVDEKL